MSRIQKRTCSICLALLFLTLAAFAVPATSHAADTIVSGNGIYEIIAGTNTVRLTRVTGTTTFQAPRQISYNGTTYSVAAIGDVLAVFNFEGLISLDLSAIDYDQFVILDSAFQENTTLTTFIPPSGPYTIEPYAFDRSALTSIAFGNCTNIGAWAFSGCTALQAATMPATAYTLGGFAFNDCDLTSIDLSNCASSIPDGVVYNNRHLSSVTLPSTPFTIGDTAFVNTSALTTVNNLSYCTSLGAAAFMGSSIADVDLTNCTLIGGNAFSQILKTPEEIAQTALRTVTWPTVPFVIGSNAFNATLLSSANLTNCTSIGSGTFHNAQNLTAVDWPTVSFTLSNTAFVGTKITAANLSHCIGTIGASAFANVTTLTSATFPTAPFAIGDNTFINTQIPLADLSTCSAVGASAFSGCTKLETVEWPSADFTIGAAAFQGTKITIANLQFCTSIGANAFNNLAAPIDIFVDASKLTAAGANFAGSSKVYIVAQTIAQLEAIANANTGAMAGFATIPAYAYVGPAGSVTILAYPASANQIGTIYTLALEIRTNALQYADYVADSKMYDLRYYFITSGSLATGTVAPGERFRIKLPNESGISDTSALLVLHGNVSNIVTDTIVPESANASTVTVSISSFSPFAVARKGSVKPVSTIVHTGDNNPTTLYSLFIAGSLLAGVVAVLLKRRGRTVR